MISRVAQWIINAIALYLTSLLISGVVIDDFVSALIAVIVMGLVNTFIKPILVFFTLPITLITLGLFTFVLNAILFLLVGNITPGFYVSGFVNALLGSLLFTIFKMILNSLARS